jgi:hypothetical protein
MNSRRDFLQRITASAFALPLVPETDLFTSHGKEEYQGPVLKVAIMGSGATAHV